MPVRLTALLLCLLLPFAAQADGVAVDGDTFDLDGQRIRLDGIDAPEIGQLCDRWACGRTASDMLAEMLASGPTDCEKLGDDAYGRIIARCTVAGRDVSAQMVSMGMAYAFVKYSDRYLPQEAEARMQGLGIWQAEYERPWDYRAAKWTQAAQVAPNGCPIKGNITKNGPIYHPPWSPWYGKTRVDEGKGERWFCSEDEALAAGWRPPRWR